MSKAIIKLEGSGPLNNITKIVTLKNVPMVLVSNRYIQEELLKENIVMGDYKVTILKTMI